jgi:hypothetical protein
MRIAKISLPILLLVIFSAQIVSPAQVTNNSPAIIFVDLSVNSWLDNYLHLAKIKVKQDESGDSPMHLMLGMPYLELFSPTGESLYRGSNAEQNAAFLHDLQHAIPSRPVPSSSDWHPSLRDYVVIAPPLQSYQSQIFNSRQLTLLAVTYTDKPFCQAQNVALKQFATHPNIRIVEIILHS